MEDEETEYTSVDATSDAEDMLDAICELEECAFEILLKNPKCNKRKFVKEIMKEHWDKAADAFGLDPEIICASVLKLWDTPYYDAQSVQEHTFKEWAIMFAEREKVDNYIRLYRK